MTFEPTHRLVYSENGKQFVWMVMLLDNHSAIDESGNADWRCEQGKWIDLRGRIKRYPHGELEVTNLEKMRQIRVKKGSESAFMPVGTKITAVRREDGTWHGSCESHDSTVTRDSNGLVGLMSRLCSDWIRQNTGRTDVTLKPPGERNSQCN